MGISSDASNAIDLQDLLLPARYKPRPRAAFIIHLMVECWSWRTDPTLSWQPPQAAGCAQY